MVAAAKYIGAKYSGLTLNLFDKSVKEMENILLFPSHYVSTFIFYRGAQTYCPALLTLGQSLGHPLFLLSQ